jgi:molybdate transport system ATP-binding protein
MPGLPHTAIYTDNHSRKEELAQQLLHGTPPPELSFLGGRSGAHFSNARIARMLDEEARHDHVDLDLGEDRKLATYSSGERRKALLDHLLESSPDFLVFDNLFDNLDQRSRERLLQELQTLSKSVILVQLLSRPEDLLPFIRQRAYLDVSNLVGYPDYHPPAAISEQERIFTNALPAPPVTYDATPKVLVEFRDVHLSYGKRPILNGIDWNIAKGSFWELRGPNGSGKTSLITMINGDNPKAYGQEIYLFGRRKGSGESVWDIKQQIGYFTPALTDRFRGNHRASHMLISGITDSVGLYVRPTDRQLQLAQQWLALLGMETEKDALFRSLTEGQQRLLMCARAMIKHPPLLILDEPTGGLDEASAKLLISLVRKMALESETAIVFVSHREEPGLRAEHVLELIPGASGATGVIHHNTPE